MSEQSLTGRSTTDWHRALAEAVRDAEQLIELLNLPGELLEPAQRLAQQFPLLVPRSYLGRMQPGNPLDPLLLQVLPLGAEEEVKPGFSTDAVGDGPARLAPGLLHKYAGRALLIATGSCAVHCRYCFRRSYPYADEPRRLEDWQPALDAIAGDESLHEIILSGGDPLMLTDTRLRELVSRLESIPHIRRLRVHTRLPIVLPERVTGELLDLLTATRLTPIIVVHANHHQELQGSCANALQQLVRSGMTVLNQAVLLKGINDTLNSQAALCEGLIDLGVIPYYLHQLDRVQGTAHFEVEESVGRALIDELRAKLPGYAVPQYVREVRGEVSKLPL